MLRKLSISLAVLLVLSGSTVASAATPRQVKALKHRVSVLTKANTHLSKANSELETRASDFAVKFAQTQVALGSAVQERDFYKAQLDSIPSETQQGINIVRDEVAYTKMISTREESPVDDGYLISVAAMNYVVGHVLAPEYGYRHEVAFLPLPLWKSAEQALQMQAGICGNAALVFATIVRAFNLPVRSVQFYYGANNHIAAETYYDGAWHYFDPTWGIMFTASAQSISDARSNQTAPLSDQTLLWHLTAPVALADTGVLTAPTTVVELGKQF